VFSFVDLITGLYQKSHPSTIADATIVNPVMRGINNYNFSRNIAQMEAATPNRPVQGSATPNPYLANTFNRGSKMEKVLVDATDDKATQNLKTSLELQ
jgi:hypothetical protein